MTDAATLAGLADFRAEVRAFCAAALPADIRERTLRDLDLAKDDYDRWMKILGRKGWLVGHWPRAYGGLGWSRLQRVVFEEEAYRAGSPWILPFGPTYVGPVIYTFGDDAQRARHLPPIRDNTIWWCQGYSEPGAGSDLASLRTKAVRRGDKYVVTGQKIWTTMAHWADMMFTLVRTADTKKPQDGISFLLIDLRAPGITIRPIVSIDLCHHLNEVFLDEVEVPVENLVGTENAGWTYAKYLLNNERLLTADVGRHQRELARLRALLADTVEEGATLADDPIWRRRMAELEARLIGLEAMARHALEDAERGQEPGPEVSILKVVGSELGQSIAGATLDALARTGIAYQHEALHPGFNGPLAGPEGTPGMVKSYLYGRAETIFGGSGEVQRNILAKAALGL